MNDAYGDVEVGPNIVGRTLWPNFSPSDGSYFGRRDNDRSGSKQQSPIPVVVRVTPEASQPATIMASDINGNGLGTRTQALCV
ncbi:hypothetical protein N7455_000970 [Penicillium solitum]|uniref:uncharacterized protein n=1 Tax=Penicillium solitum TaxID=60172 RepID=UPI001831CA6C|nr:hypothetical protein HAV15_007622 [Penicillium sp. str. \